MKYEQSASLNISMGQKRKEDILTRAYNLAINTGWEEGVDTGGKRPNASAVVNELIDIGFIVLEQFGEDWHDHLSVQSEPVWAKKHLAKIVDLIEKLPTISNTEQAEIIEEIRADMDVGGMLE